MFESLFDLYLTSLQAEGVTPATLRWHKSCLKKFNGYLANNGESEKPDDWTAFLFRSHIVHLQTPANRNGAPHAPHAIQSYVRSLRAFCQWLTDEEFVSANPMRKVKQPKAPALVKPTVNRGSWNNSSKRRKPVAPNFAISPYCSSCSIPEHAQAKLVA